MKRGWEAVANEAQQARCLYAQAQGWPLCAVVEYLRFEGLTLYADALAGVIEWTELVF